jgi:exonuclease VII large subunit
MNSPWNNPWNMAVVDILVEEFLAKQEQEWQHLPVRSQEYIRDLITAKFQRCRSIWNRTKPRETYTGETETTEDVEARMNKKKEESLKAQRHATRRINVSI